MIKDDAGGDHSVIKRRALRKHCAILIAKVQNI